ncbi:MAG: response regulator transcription factor, partial [Candidatus Saccharibacteria bacterium]|nr:response regulator transcription factor [Pseudorhodobacter sp.]
MATTESDNIFVKSAGTDIRHWHSRAMGKTLILLILGGQHLDEDAARSALSRLQYIVGDAPIVVMLDDITGADIDHALKTGLRGLICTKDEAPIALAAIRFLIAGGSYIPHDRAYTSRLETNVASVPDHAEVVIAKDQSARSSDLITTLTPRQEEVFAVLAKGASNKSIARTLSLSEATVKIHVRNIFQKLSVN